jgi:hypothetical protein
MLNDATICNGLRSTAPSAFAWLAASKPAAIAIVPAMSRQNTFMKNSP